MKFIVVTLLAQEFTRQAKHKPICDGPVYPQQERVNVQK
jgi:hypothetical protein